jgi:hypothetical protein
MASSSFYCPSTFLLKKAHTFIEEFFSIMSATLQSRLVVGTSVVELGTKAVLSYSSDDRPSAHLAIKIGVSGPRSNQCFMSAPRSSVPA